MGIRFAKVIAGHDKNHVYFVAGEDETNVLLANGTTKKIEHPKKKAKIHVQIIKRIPIDITALFCEEMPSDKIIQTALKEYEEMKISTT